MHKCLHTYLFVGKGMKGCVCFFWCAGVVAYGCACAWVCACAQVCASVLVCFVLRDIWGYTLSFMPVWSKSANLWNRPVFVWSPSLWADK